MESMTNINIEKTQEQARRILDSRIESVTQLVKTRQRITDLKQQLADAERDDKRAYVKALKDGWSEDELRKLGLENAAAKRRTTAPRNQPHSPAPATTDAGAQH
jgi:hypothetical protein